MTTTIALFVRRVNRSPSISHGAVRFRGFSLELPAVEEDMDDDAEGDSDERDAKGEDVLEDDLTSEDTQPKFEDCLSEVEEKEEEEDENFRP